MPNVQIDKRYFDSPYYITPTNAVGQEAFAVIRDAMRGKGMVALGRVVLAKRERMVAIEPYEKGLLATTLRYPYEVRDASAYFEDIADIKVPGEMLKLADHILDSKTGDFEPLTFVDHYEAALVELLRQKQAGVQPKAIPSAPPQHRVINLMDALRRSIETETPKKPAAGQSKARRSTARRKRA